MGAPSPGTLVYCCGPDSLLSAVEEAGAAWPDEAVRVERFAAPVATEDDAGVVEIVHERSFEVELASTGEVLAVGADQTVLEVLVAAGADVYSDCEEGICSTCETRVLEGLPDHRDHVLSAAERDSGEVMMVCVSRALTDRLVLDL
jgi:ferredoxin